MIWIYVIFALIIIASLAEIIFIIFKNRSKLAALNIESIPQEKENKVRNRIMIERLKRNSNSLVKIVNELLKPVFEVISEKLVNFNKQIQELETKVKPKPPLQQIDLHQEIADKLIKIEKYLAEDQYVKVEEECIDIISLDAKNTEAYRILAQMYWEQKDYKKSRQTYKYLIKLMEKESDKHILANTYVDLGEVYENEHKPKQAMTSYQRAVSLEPNNPRFLDLLLKISIILKNKKMALEAFNSLKNADPENQKLPEIEVEINGLPDIEPVEEQPTIEVIESETDSAEITEPENEAEIKSEKDQDVTNQQS